MVLSALEPSTFIRKQHEVRQLTNVTSVGKLRLAENRLDFRRRGSGNGFLLYFGCVEKMERFPSTVLINEGFLV